MTPLVIYHANCADGFGAAFAAWTVLGDDAEYAPMNYLKSTDSDEQNWGKFCAETHDLQLPAENGGLDREIYILDFSLPRFIMDRLFIYAKRVVWLDHHKTAFEMWCGGIPKTGSWGDSKDEGSHIHLDNNKSGAMLAWEYFHPGEEVPMLIRHIDDYDRWQFKIPGTKQINKALWSYTPWAFGQWKSWLNRLDDAPDSKDEGSNMVYHRFIAEGEAILRAHEQNVCSVVEGAARKCSIDPMYFPWGFAANCPPSMTSDVGHELAVQSGTFGLCWWMTKDGKIACSLRSDGDYDVSAIAKALGGGGHKNAAGFETDMQTLMGWLK